MIDAFLGLGFVFGDDLPRNQAFTAALKRAYRAIAAKGVLAAAREM